MWLYFPKTQEGKELSQEVSAFILQLKEDGRLAEITEKWLYHADEEGVTADLSSLEAEEGKRTLRLSFDLEAKPFTFMKDNEVQGLEVELVAMFCREYGYGLELCPMEFTAIIPSLTKNDIGCGTYSITEERKESVWFSEPYFETKAVVLSKASVESKNIITSIGQSFIKTFVTENRWKLVVQGIGTTVYITVASALAGILLGFAVYLAYRRNNRIVCKITDFFTGFLTGLPVVVFLMILYYVIFENSSISGTTVAVIGFTLLFACSVIAMLKMGVGAVDKGQFEAGYALGYTENQTFFSIILPQAARHFMPTLKGELVSHIKATSVVGYIAVQDLTKMGDIIRSRTFEAFFPLLAVAALYFAVSFLLIRIVNLTEYLSKRKRTEAYIRKGVRTDD